MELNLQISQDSGASAIYGNFEVPCKGYYTNFRMYIFNVYDGFQFSLGKGVDITSFHGATDVIPVKKGLYVALQTAGSNPVPKVVTGFTKKKIHVNNGEVLHFRAIQETQGFDILVQATFVPYKGQILKARHVVTMDEDGPIADSTAYVVPINGRLKAIQLRAMLHETDGAAGGAYKCNVYHFNGNQYYDPVGNIASARGDVFGQQDDHPSSVTGIQYGKVTLAEWTLRTVQNEPQLYDLSQNVDVPVSIGDRINHDWDNLTSDTAINTTLLEFVYFIEVMGTPIINLATEHIDFMYDGAQNPEEWFMDLGSDLFMEV